MITQYIYEIMLYLYKITQTYCTTILFWNTDLTTSNILIIWNNTLNCFVLYWNTSLQIIQRDTQDILQQPKFLTINRNTLIKILEQETLNIESEMELISATTRWGEANIQDGQLLCELLGPRVTLCLRFVTLTVEQLIQVTCTSKILPDEDTVTVMRALHKSADKRRELSSPFVRYDHEPRITKVQKASAEQPSASKNITVSNKQLTKAIHLYCSFTLNKKM